MPRKKLDDSNRRRSVESTCQFRGQGLSSTEIDTSRLSSAVSEEAVPDVSEIPSAQHRRPEQNDSNFIHSPSGLLHTRIRRRSSGVAVPQLSRLICDTKGKFTFIGDSANLSFLQSIRRLVRESVVGCCPLTEDPLKSLMVEAPPDNQHWINIGTRASAPKPNIDEARYLIRRYMIATNCILDLFDEAELLENLSTWLKDEREATLLPSTIYYLVFAIGAQTSPEDKEEISGLYFNYGRYLTALRHAEEPSIVAVQCYAMISFYLLAASRRNAAYMNLGIAIRAAQALGLHRRDISKLFARDEYRYRERTWKVLRVLDLFMSCTLGRPPSTSETRDTAVQDNYSACVDLCSIFEVILNEVYYKRMVSSEALERISGMQRRWTATFRRGLANDGIRPEDRMPDGSPNIGLYHVKEAYYLTIILVTRPFFLEAISMHISATTLSSGCGTDGGLISTANNHLVHACIDSAIRTIELLRGLICAQGIPKRLPYVVNSIFVAALVIGTAFFGDMDRILPLDGSLCTAQQLLRMFPADAVSRRDLAIVEYLQEACQMYIEQRTRRRMDFHGQLVGDIFGNVDKFGTAASESRVGGQNRPHSPEQALDIGFNTLSSPTAPGRVDSVATNIDNILSSWANPYSDSLAPVPPRTLCFQPVEDAMPLFSTVNTVDMDI
ncbi:hypothetical protein NECHADRAFT_53697 [Paecilomyces variotii No. 5]|uniref:Xylanolytic transcriptional activator regulatory domain-containing protein n=1 Tax=Byssochlamys spectabilis (strain No. 5 / NBRC 109023) TaxID=1356009 RepID=V5FBN5_BYSSN|nr:hypothetical protein NECHADRAFT_53697 [Paecilomyces variotii No. 5]